MNDWSQSNWQILKMLKLHYLYVWIVPVLLILVPSVSPVVQSSSSNSGTFVTTSGSGNNGNKFLEDCETTLIQQGSSDVAVSCNLRTINSEFDKTNFSQISGESVLSLSIVCSDVLFYQSALEAGSLSHLDRLTSLHVEHCKLSRLPPAVFSGLSHLRNLTIRTHNTAWPALSLDIAKGVFNGLPHLEKIDLSANNIWTFPEKLFCPTGALESLNISLNRIQDIGDLSFREKETSTSSSSSSSSFDLGLLVKKSSNIIQGGGGGGCKTGIQILDISSNRLILLPTFGLSTLSQLKELYVQDNEISVIGERALGGLKGLKLFNIANNKIINLPENIFQDCKDIVEINLQNNSLTILPIKLLSNLEQLVVLDLSHNTLTSDWMNGYIPNLGRGNNESIISSSSSGTFTALIRLVVLNLGYNRLTKLIPNTFRDLYSLQILNIEHNLVESIDGNTFSSMNNLHTLILSYNSLITIDSTTLNGLFVLSLLSLDNNNITNIAPTAFHNCSSLKDVNLNGNNLNGIPLAIQNLTVLKTVDLGENNINQLEIPRLIGLPNLYGLRLTGNQIVNVSKYALQQLPSLKVLNLARNRIEYLEKNGFDTNINLQAVRLDANFLTNISGLFTQSRNLIWLNISDNLLSIFDYSFIPKQLQWLDLHKNEINDLGNIFQRIDLRLQTLDASFNRIKKLNAGNIPDSLEMLFLNDNLITHIEPHTFYMKLNLSRVDIFANQIETMDLSSLRLKPFMEGKSLPEFYIGGNPIICDCNMEWLQRINKLDHSRQHPKVMDLESVYCKLVYHREKYYVPLIGADPVQFLCSYKAHCFALCHCCEFDACDCEMTCPNNCTCYHDDTWSANIVDCASKGHIQIPSRIPMDSSEVYLDGNYFHELKRHMFIGRKNLQVLYLNSSGIYRIANNSFSGLKRLSILHLENNFLTELRGYEFEPLDFVRELYLQSNQLTYISNHSFNNLRGLEVLKLDGNRLTRFSIWVLSQNPYLVEIALSNNPWSCDCDYMSQASQWVQTNVAKLMDASGVNCRLNGKSFSLVYINGTTCSDITALSGAIEAPDSKVPLYLTLLGSALLFGIVFSFFIIGICKKRRNTNVNKCPLNLCCQTSRKSEDREKLYDAYVAYSVKDEPWVNQILVTELQQSGDYPYKLCLHYKDLRTNSTYISDTISEAVDCSKRTILILSKNFLQSEWCQFEFKSSLHSALRCKKIRLIAVTLGDFTARDLDPDLRVTLRSATVLSTNDKLFWTKLRCALPDPSSISHSRNCTQLISQQPSSCHDNHASWNGVSVNVNFPPLNGNNGTMGRSSFSNNSVSASSVYVPVYPPPNRPPPPFPTFRPPPPPTPLWG